MLPFIAELSPPMQERVVCSISAAMRYEIPANILLAVAEKEAGKPGQWVRNTNGTHDVGVMQFNTSYLRELSRYGIGPQDVAAAGCYPYELAAWRLRMHIRKDQGDIWTRAANYHSRTQQYNSVYRADLIRRAARWEKWIESHFSTVDMGPAIHKHRESIAASGSAPRQTGSAPLTRSAGYVPRQIQASATP